MIGNLCRHKPAVNFQQVKDSIPYLYESLTAENDQEILIDNLWTSVYVSELGDEAALLFINSGILQKIATILLTPTNNITILAAILRTISNIVGSGNAEATDYVIGLNVIPTIISLITHHKKGIRKDACFLLSNVAAGTQSQIDFIFKFPSLLSQLKNISCNDDVDVIMEALCVISNSMIGGSRDHKLILIKSDIFYEILSTTITILGAKGLRVYLEGLKEYLSFIYEERINSPETSKLTTLLQQTNGPKEGISKQIENMPEVMSIFTECMDTLEDFKEEVLGQGVTQQLGGLNLNDPTYQNNYGIED